MCLIIYIVEDQKGNTSAYEGRRIVRISRRNVVSSRTVRLKETNLKNCVTRRKPYITEVRKNV